MKEGTLIVYRDPTNHDVFIASYDMDIDNEAHNLAYKGSMDDAVEAALNVYGLSKDEVSIEASD